MGFFGKLAQLAREVSEMLPPEEPKPTIDKDYPEKWAEVKRRRRIARGCGFVIVAACVLLGLLRLQEFLPSPLFDAAAQTQLHPIFTRSSLWA